mmetsp:Transcript_20170/g.36532  ORF Transcript_20170/g.36532 Transcript_20170/m.36532 type:complete len:453 (-) Transcript_20170:103-1461(-)
MADAPIAEADAAVVEEEIDQELAAAAVMYDITAKMTPYLDHHLIVPVLNFLKGTGMYKMEDMIRAELEVASQTKMVDVVADLRVAINEPVDDLEEKKKAVVEELNSRGTAASPILQILESQEQYKELNEMKNIEDMCKKFNLEHDIMDKFLQLAKLKFDCGDYTMARDLLKHYRAIMAQDPDRPVTQEIKSSAWGQLGSDILEGEVEDAADMVYKLDEMLENTKNLPKKTILSQRRWLLHWALFIIFHEKYAGERASPKLLEFFLSDKSVSIISISCPWLFRYVGACLILNKRLKNTIMKESVWVISHEDKDYSDPVTRFLIALYVDMDFDEAQRELTQCKLVCYADYFLKPHWKEFEENARLLIFETYCRIHQCINIEMIASKLNMKAEEAELWIVKLIQSAKLDARIDSEKKRVVMSKAPPSVYQQVIEKTKNLAFRSTMLLSNLEKREK